MLLRSSEWLFFDIIYSDMKLRNILLLAVWVSAASLFAQGPGVSPGPGARYATDAYPGFDSGDEVIKPEKKDPRWFAWWNGPAETNAAAQFAWCQAREAEGSTSKACKGYDALVREWPTAPEAPKAQLRLAELLLSELEYEDAFKAYRYLLDFYSSACDFSGVAEKMYQVAELMREEGKTILFFRFRNTVDVRRAYESLVLRAPGAPFTTRALLTIASLREEEEKPDQAVAVYENLINHYPDTEEAVEAAYRLARVRMAIVRERGYNRTRVRDTMNYMNLALRETVKDEEQRAEMKSWISECEALLEAEAWNAAKFYDARTRTRRSAINAYAAFLKDYPAGAHSDEVRARLMELEGGEVEK